MEYLDCHICQQGSLKSASEVRQIACNVRYFKDHTFTVWRCSSCGSLHCKEDIDFNLYYKHYPLSSQKPQFLTSKAYQNRLKFLLRAGLQPSDLILDYGCGRGLFLDFLSTKGYANSFGFDPYIEEKSDTRILGKQYDFVYSFGVIEHVVDPIHFLAEQAQLLRPLGKLLIATPNAAGISLERSNDLLLHQPYHRHILSLPALVNQAANFGLTLQKDERTNWLDTSFPGLNSRFISDYIKACGGHVDCLFERKKIMPFFTNPKLAWLFWFGSYLSLNDYMICTFHKEDTLN